MNPLTDNTTATFEVPTRENVAEAAQPIFDNLKSQFGTVPNLFATIGYSPNALSSYLAFSGAQAKGGLNIKERETVNLATSEINNCNYCKAVHTVIGQSLGFSEDETLQLRAGTIEDPKLNALSNIAREITAQRGNISEATAGAFFQAGYSKGDLIDVIALVADKTFTNYVYAATKIPVDFPEAQAI